MARGLPQHRPASLILPNLIALGLLLSLGATRSLAQAQAANSPVYAVPIVVSDFELYSAPPPKPARSGKPQVTPPTPKPEVPLIYSDTAPPPDQARRLIDFFSMTLLQTLRDTGFRTVEHGGTPPPAGAQIRGVFAEPDALNRIRRAILGAGSPNGKFLLYIGIFNLGKPHQPLYELATEQPQDPGYGPVITPNNYIPLVKYELDKNPGEEDVRKICNQIVESLKALLVANPMAFSQ